MKIAYDFHIHTVASPCGDELMSPNNIVNMALLKNLEAIAITDHNTCANCEAVINVGKQKNLVVIPGMEIECQEEFHCLALFPSLEAALKIEKEVLGHLPSFKNKVTIFGHQWKMSEEDEVVEELEPLLLTATQITAKDLFDEVRSVQGIIYPAHIDRKSYSILANLGMIPSELNIKAVEISKMASKDYYELLYPKYHVIQSSDAHYLEDIAEAEYFLEVTTLDIKEIFRAIETNKN